MLEVSKVAKEKKRKKKEKKKKGTVLFPPLWLLKLVCLASSNPGVRVTSAHRDRRWVRERKRKKRKKERRGERKGKKGEKKRVSQLGCFAK